uniref:Small ribosomal subunit protein uS3m n=1 Tax=Aspergillus pseudoglaucus TaxID=1405805 RepID=A0A411NIS2_ASPPE|nr:ribosomal protein S5 [Aspergillus pseudoglaucus]QBF44549.1 ribosomal protein S5 [Aspergillus pseudoglaucus]
MLNIIRSKLKNTYKKKSLNNGNVTIYNKDFVPAVRDWKNSIYVYNKNALSLIPVASRLVIKLIKGYLNSYNLNIESKLRKERLRRRIRKLSTNKIFVSDGEFKHTNDKVNITLYVYNRQKLNYLLKLKKRYTSLFKKEKFLNKLKLIRKVGLNILKKQQENIKVLTNVLPNYNSKVYSIQNLYYKDFIIKSLKRLKYYMLYKQLLYINKTKFEYSYLQGLINLIRKIYKKNVEFNIINLKYFYFNSDIFTQPLVLKLRKERKLLRYLKSLVKKSKINKIKLDERSRYFFDLENLFTVNNDFDTRNNFLNDFIKQNKTEYLKKVVLNNIKYKRVSGVRIEGAGRLTKRYTASRSQHKVRYKGNLVNVYSSIKGYPSSILRGNFKPNLQYTKLNSKSRIGSFGVKGWVSGI